MRTHLLASLGLGALAASGACFAADDAGSTPAPVAQNTVAEYEFPHFAEGTKHTFDLATIPAATRMDFLTGAVRAYIANRLNSAPMRHEKDEQVIAWKAYEAATAADPLQSAVAKPAFDKPADPNYGEVLARAFKDLTEGNIRKVGDGPEGQESHGPARGRCHHRCRPRGVRGDARQRSQVHFHQGPCGSRRRRYRVPERQDRGQGGRGPRSRPRPLCVLNSKPCGTRSTSTPPRRCWASPPARR
jgi:hypothetical protein